MNYAALAISPEFDRELGRLQRGSLLAGVAAMALCALGAFFGVEQFLRSYLAAFMFWVGVALGCTAILMLQHLTGGAWGLVIRRMLESASRTFYMLALLFVPLALGVTRLYPWARPGAADHDELLRHKSAYLNVPFFLGRAALYFAIWICLAHFLNKWSGEQDRTGDPAWLRKLQLLGGPGLVLYGATVTFAAIDWVMSLDPHWFSTIFGVLFMGAQGVSALAFIILITTLLARRRPFSEIIHPAHLHDLGKLLLAFVMLWAYFNFSQYLIIWSGNLPEEITWYLHRTRGGWQWIGLLLVLFHFALPFVLLLSRDTKRNFRLLASIAGLIILMRFVDLFWLVAPNFHSEGLSLHWMDFLTPVGLGGFWLSAFLGQLRKLPLLPLRDPQLEEALAHGHA